MSNFNMKIAIVNDTLIAAEALRRVLVTVPEYEIIWIAADGAEAVSKCARNTPDLILMDLIMPVMDGVEATRLIMKQSPCAILLVTSSVTGNASRVFEAMGYGALDAINTPILGLMGNSQSGGVELLKTISKVARLIGKTNSTSIFQNATPKCLTPPLLAIGSSTGGPQALATLLSALPGNLSAAVAIVQHVDAEFAPGLADWLSQKSKLAVSVAVADRPLEVGKVVIAATNDHLVLQSNLTLKYTKEPLDYPYRPSVDTFFDSVAQYWPGKGVAVLLTGMGKDGAKGLKVLRSARWHTIAQDRATSVVYGMPKAAADLNAAVQVLPIEAIAPACMKYLV
ncbi:MULTISPECIES: chemotaxis response regulator protein-glutamate methylesterase [unclassified Microcoleus]|uniref:chemotaxis response regulator protein-glutamate methylesterase n=1 Tax=unclassified Microcoleus TaxID=2642155 RepID=UPI0025FA2852|nr:MULTISPECIES: chemotaxis response regulator protein-glutamate methylesterase [unclassified Microcoleus]